MNLYSTNNLLKMNEDGIDAGGLCKEIFWEHAYNKKFDRSFGKDTIT